MRTSRRDRATRLERGRRSGRGAPRNRHARWDGLHVERAAHRHELSDVGVGDPLWPFLMATEAISRDPDHRIPHGDVPVHVDVGHVDVRGAIHDDVVDDAWPTPAAPRSDPDEARTTPPRNQRFAPGERRPAERPDAETNSHAAAEEDDEGRRVHGPDEDRAGRPRPVAADEDPAAVVIGRPAPRRVVEPRPAESSVPDPPTRAVRHPPRRHTRGRPHRAIRFDGAPAPVLFERLGPVYACRHVAGGVEQVGRALIVPAVPRRERRRRGRLHARRIGPGDDELLVGGDRRCSSARRRHRRDAAPMSVKRSRVLGHIETVVACSLHRERRVGRVELDGEARGRLAQVERRVSVGHTELEEVGFMIVQTELRVLGGAHERPRADLELYVATGPRVQDVSRSERRVHHGRRPVFGARPPEGHLSVDVAHARRRDLGRLRRRLSVVGRRGRHGRWRG